MTTRTSKTDENNVSFVGLSMLVGRNNAIRVLLDSLCDADYRSILIQEDRLNVLPIEWTIQSLYNTGTQSWETLIEV